ncbi:uncharacterized protein LOC126909744, partial [Daktulosphaira vitifoliae]|uniref:uncharacterized protein LOC126909744 n=1 Tax=Daktulosphaira vitifoliae TaxID=58002 RepID=UPI0021AA11C2
MPVALSTVSSIINTHEVLLGTALGNIRDQYGIAHQVRILIDSVSQISAMTAACAKRLGLHVAKWTAPVNGLAGVSVPQVQGILKCDVTPRHSDDPSIPVQALILPSITCDIPRCPIPVDIKKRVEHLALADPTFDVSSSIDVLLGADVYPLVLDGKQVSLGSFLPAAFSSIFGWVIIGSVGVASNLNAPQVCVASLSVSLEELVSRFWEVEEPETCGPPVTEDDNCEAIIQKNMNIDDCGRYCVPLPFRHSNSKSLLKGSRKMALKRFENLEKRLCSNETLAEAYRSFMREYESLGHMHETSKVGDYYIPHHAVVKPGLDGQDIRLRVVFDASARAPSGYSLNDCLFPGPKLQSDIVNVLALFRTYKYVFSSDICKMYRQINVLPEHQSFQHILWRDSPECDLKEFELSTVTYGVTSAPYLAIRVLHEVANKAIEFPAVQLALRAHTYVDDICSGADSLEEVLNLQRDLTAVLGQVGFELKKWATNCSVLSNQIPKEDRTLGATEFAEEVPGLLNILGMVWNPVKDEFSYITKLSENIMTKRGVLSSVARLFDPLGFLAPSILLAKSIMQLLWKEKCGWDDALPAEIQRQWLSFVSQLPSFSDVKIPRSIIAPPNARVQLLGFSDASLKGYAALAYLRVVDDDSIVHVYFLGGKTKLAPIKSMSVPRLELCAAALLARWLARWKTILSDRFVIKEIFAWTDSTIVLSWLTTPQVKFKIFVTNRIGQVRSLVPECIWLYVPTQMNPADCASRGMLPSELVFCSLYWQGPEFLRCPSAQWECTFPCINVAELPEVVQSTTVVLVAQSEEEWLVQWSSYTQSIRRMAWILRFYKRFNGHHYSSAILSQKELEEALMALVKVSQRYYFAQLIQELHNQLSIINRYLSKLAPFLDESGVIRVGG